MFAPVLRSCLLTAILAPFPSAARCQSPAQAAPALAQATVRASATSRSSLVSVEDLFPPRPAGFEAHASTIVELTKAGEQSEKGSDQHSVRLAAAWFAGTEERDPDVEIWFATWDGKEWSAARSIATGVQSDGSRFPCWNPVLFQQPNGPLHLFFKVGPRVDAWWGMHQTSKDGGQTWSTAKRLPEDILGPIKNKGYLLPEGKLLCGSSTEFPTWTSHFEIYDYEHDVWERSLDLPVVDDLFTIQPTILPHANGSLQALFRVDAAGPIAESWSTDQGRTWSPLKKTSLIHPDSGLDGLRLPDGRLALLYNDSPSERSPLVLATSKDGKTWKTVVTLESEPGEFSYPACIVTSDGMFHGSYTWKRQTIRHVVLDPAKF